MNAAGHMEVGGCDLVELAREHGTPLYVYDEATVRQRASEYVAAVSYTHLTLPTIYSV